MKILIVTNTYHPVINPRAFRWTSIAELWREQGHTVTVLTSWRPGLPDFEERNGVDVCRAGRSSFQRLRLNLLERAASEITSMGAEQGRAVPRNEYLKGFRSTALSLMKKLSDYTWKKVHWPDCECLWYMPAVKRARSLVAGRDFDLLISVSTPFTSHLIGQKVKSLSPPVRWIVDIGDPFSFHTVEHQNNYAVYNRLNFAAERKVFAGADGISVTSQEILDRYVSYFPDCADRIRVIPPLVSFPENHSKERKPFFEKSDRIRLLFSGNFYRPVRRPAFLLRLFRELLKTAIGDRIELHIMGSIRTVKDFFAPYEDLIDGKKIVLHGTVDHALALDAMFDTDVLVNIGNDTTYQLPSKIVDYMATGKPIVNLASVRNDSSSQALREYPSSITVTEEECTAGSPIFRELVDFLENLPKKLDAALVDTLIRPYTREVIAASYLSMVE